MARVGPQHHRKKNCTVLGALTCFLACKAFSWVGVPWDMKNYFRGFAVEESFGGGHCCGLLCEKCLLLILNGLSAVIGGFAWLSSVSASECRGGTSVCPRPLL